MTVGFFNNPAKDGDALLHEYEKAFDMVVVGDGNLHFLHYFLMQMGHLEGRNPCPSIRKMLRYEDLGEIDHEHHTHRINELFGNAKLT